MDDIDIKFNSYKQGFLKDEKFYELSNAISLNIHLGL